MIVRPAHIAYGAFGLAAAILLASALTGSGSPPADGPTVATPQLDRPTQTAPPARPDDCTEVPPGADLPDRLAAADTGDAFCLQAGRYKGPLRITTPLTIWGPTEAVVDSADQNSTLFVRADGVRLAGFTIAGSGNSYTEQDAGIFVTESDGVLLEGLTIRDVLFGITSQKVDRLTIRHTSISCRTKRALGMRGDGIRLWETRQSLVDGNRLEACRDMVVWYSPDNAFVNNRVQGGRYGTHFMYSSRNYVHDNLFVGNVVGIFAMYSRNLVIDRNVLADAAGSAGVGIGLKESGNLEITRNRFLHNTTGTYIDTSPLHRDDRNLYALNEFRLGNAGVVFHSSPRATDFVANTIRDNVEAVKVEGGGDATDINWAGNYWGRYAGYDLDADGVGDVPFELRTVSGTLLSRYPNLQLFHGTAAMFAIEASSRVSPLYTPEKVLSDQAPLMQPPDRDGLAERLEEIRADDAVLRVDRSGRFPTVRPIGTAADAPTKRY